MKTKAPTTIKKILISILIGSFVFSPAVSEAVIFEPGFETEVVASGFVLPTAMAFAQDGRIFVAEKGGTVRVVKNGTLLPTPVISLTDINTFADRGLIGIATDPNFLTNGYLYLSYTYENTPGANFGGSKTGRVVRVTVVGDVAEESSKVVLVGTVGGNAATPSCDDYALTDDCIPSNSGSHSVGGLRFGTDGKLYATMGDGAHFDFVDPNSMKAQNLDSLAGKVLRINTDGTAPSDNPFYTGNANDNRSKVYALGVRNAYRLNVNPATGAMYLGDVGWSSWEEVNLLTPGANYGWPCREGLVATTHNCTPSSTASDPLYTYAHDASGAGSVAVGSFPANGAYPAAYDTSLFFGDYAQNFIKRLVLDAAGAVVSVQDFMDDPNGPVDISTGPDGNVYYLAIYTGDLMRITHTTGNRRPVPTVAATPTSGLAPLSVAFSSTGSYDPDGDALAYLWNFGDGATSNAQNPTHEYTTNGSYSATLLLTDALGSTASKSVDITVGNQAPAASITSPASGSLYVPFDVIQLSGDATDLEDGTLPASAFHWQIILHHNVHIHHIEEFTNTKNPSFIAPDHEGDDIYTEVVLTVTDSAGLTDTRSINLYRNNGAQSGNLISNPSVEVEDSNPNLPLGWASAWFGALDPTFTYPVSGLEGAKAMKVQLNAFTSGSAKWFFSPVFVTPGETYTFSSRYTSTVQTELTAQYGFANGTSQFVTLAIVPASADNTLIEQSITIPPDVQTLTVVHEIAAVGELITDDFSLTLASEELDTTPPTASVTAPANGATVSGNAVVINATAADNVGVAGVKLVIDGVDAIGEDTENPYAYTWNTTLLADGPHTIAVRARDPANNVFTSPAINVTVQNSTSTQPTNPILNPSLETDGGAGNPANWLRGGWGTNTAVFTYPVAGSQGAKGAKVELTAFTNGDAKWFFADVPVTAGDDYTIAHDYKSTATTEILARWTLVGGTTQYQFLGTVPASAAWTTSTYNITAPTGATSVTLFHVIASVGSLEIDNYILTGETAPPPPPPSSNLIQNPSLETAGAGGDPANWLRGGWGTNNRVFTYPTTGVAGADAAKVEITSYTDGDAKWYFTDVPVTPGTAYTFSHQYKSTVSTQILARYTMTGGTTQYAFMGVLPASASWATSNFTLTAPANAVSVTVFHVVHSVGALEIDNFSLTGPGGASDTTDPTVSITSPASGATLTGTVSVTANAADNIGVAGVSLLVDGAVVGAEDTTSPYAFSLNTATLSNGAHSISARARDAAGNDANATAVSVTVSNSTSTPPTNLISNGNFETANGTLPLDWAASKWGNHTAVHTYPVIGFNGQKAARVEITAYPPLPTGSGDAKWSFKKVPVTPGTEYTYSDHYRSNTISDIVGQYTLTDGSFHYFGLAKEIQPNTTWQTITGKFTPPANATHVTLFHLISAVGYLEIDDAEMYVTGSSTPSETNAPIVAFTNPLEGQTVSGIVPVTASSTDDTAVTYILYAVDGIPVTGQITAAPYLFNWDSKTVSNGPHLLKATTHDPYGNNATQTITVNVNNTVTPPDPTNLILNPSLETDLGGGNAANWIKGGWGTNNRVFTYPVIGHDGGKAAKVQITSYTDGDAKWYFDNVSVTPGNIYTFENKYKSDTVSNITIRYTMSSGSFQYLELANPAPTPLVEDGVTRDWVSYSRTFSPPTGAVSMTVMHILNSVGYLEVDEYKLYAGNPLQFDNGKVSLIFDDGWVSQYTTAFPMLQAANMKAGFYIITNETLEEGAVGSNPELINNAGLETVGGGGDPAGWLRGGWGTNDRAFTYPVAGDASASAARVAITTYTNGDAKWYFTDVPVTPGKQYTLKDRYNSNVESYATVRYTKTDGTSFYAYQGALASTLGAWQSLERTVTVPADVVSMTLFHVIAGVGALSVDNFSLKEVGGAPAQDYMNPTQVLEIQAAGHEIGSHTKTHPDLSTLSGATLQDEVVGSKNALLGMGVTQVDTIVYPYGGYDAEVITTAQGAGYIGGRSVERGYNTPDTNKFALQIQGVLRDTTLAEVQGWVNQAAANNAWLILMFHEVDNNPVATFGTTPEILQGIINHVSTADIDVITMRQGIQLMNP